MKNTISLLPPKPILLVDLDGVVLELYEQLADELGIDINEITDTRLDLCIGLEKAEKAAALYLSPAFQTTLKAYPGAAALLPGGQIHGAFEVRYVTSCFGNHGDANARLETLKGLGINPDHVMFVSGESKYLISGHAMVEDTPENLLNFNGVKILITRPWNKKFDAEKHGVMRVELWELVELTKLIKQAFTKGLNSK